MMDDGPDGPMKPDGPDETEYFVSRFTHCKAVNLHCVNNKQWDFTMCKVAIYTV